MENLRLCINPGPWSRRAKARGKKAEAKNKLSIFLIDAIEHWRLLTAELNSETSDLSPTKETVNKGGA